MPELLYILWDELSGDVEKGIKGIQYGSTFYPTFSEALIENIIKSDITEALIIADEISTLGASIWIRFIDSEEGYKQFGVELRTNYVKKSDLMY